MTDTTVETFLQPNVADFERAIEAGAGALTAANGSDFERAVKARVDALTDSLLEAPRTTCRQLGTSEADYRQTAAKAAKGADLSHNPRIHQKESS